MLTESEEIADEAMEDRLEEAQRATIEASGAPIDPEQLIGGNPRGRKAERLPGFLSLFRR